MTDSCGTVAGWHRHKRRGEQPCELCLAGKHQHDRERWEDRFAHPWARLYDAALRRQRHNHKLKLPLREGARRDALLLIAAAEPNSMEKYHQMDQSTQAAVMQAIVEVPMTAEEAIMAVAEHLEMA